MDDFTIAVYDDAACGVSPLMPYVDERFCGKEFTYSCKKLLSAALLRCGFEVLDANPLSHADGNAQELALKINKSSADACIVLTYSAFGSRKSFNDIGGMTVRAAFGRMYARSKVLAEDACAKLRLTDRDVKMLPPDDAFNVVNCPTAIISGGYLTEFNEAKRVYDPDFSRRVAEYACIGICEHFGRQYVKRDDINAYPPLCMARRGKKVKMLQCMLDMFGCGLKTDGVYGAETDKAVKNVCGHCGMSKSDGVTAALWRELLLTDTPTLSFGSEHIAVRYLQNKLYSKLYPLEINGKLDRNTLDALNSFLSDTVGGGFALTESDVIDADIFKLVKPIGGGRARLF